MRYFNSLLYNKTVSPLMLWSQIIYGHRMASISQKMSKNWQKIVRFFLPPAGRRRIVQVFVNFLDIIRCPVRFSYYLKFHGARTAFCRVIEGTMTSARHRLHTSDGHRTILVWNLNRTISTAAGHRTMCEKSKDFSKISVQIGRCPSGYRPMFYESNCLVYLKRRVFAEVHIESV